MKRYNFLDQDGVYDSLNKLRDAFLAAKDGEQVEQIINSILTFDEKMKIGRRIIIAMLIKSNVGYDEIARNLNVGKNTILSVVKSLDKYPGAFEMIEARRIKVENVYSKNKYVNTGGSKLVFKKKIYTGFKRKNVKR